MSQNVETLGTNIALIAEHVQKEPAFLKRKTIEKLRTIHKAPATPNSDQTLVEVAAQNLLERGFNPEETSKIITSAVLGFLQYFQNGFNQGSEEHFVLQIACVTSSADPVMLKDNFLRQLLVYKQPQIAAKAMLALSIEQINEYNTLGRESAIDIVTKGLVQMRHTLSTK